MTSSFEWAGMVDGWWVPPPRGYVVVLDPCGEEPCWKAKLSIYWSVEMADTVGQYEPPPHGGWGLPQRRAEKVNRLVGARCFALRGVRRGLGICSKAWSQWATGLSEEAKTFRLFSKRLLQLQMVGDLKDPGGWLPCYWSGFFYLLGQCCLRVLSWLIFSFCPHPGCLIEILLIYLRFWTFRWISHALVDSVVGFVPCFLDIW